MSEAQDLFALLGITVKERCELMQRPREIHRHCCKHCPSAPHQPSDPETEDYAVADFETRRDAVFRCAWRPDKACKGMCDRLSITEGDLQNAPWTQADEEG